MYQRHLEKLSRTRLDDVLLDEDQIDRSQVEDAAAEHEMTGRQLSDVLFERSVIDEWDLAKIVCSHYSLPFLDVGNYTISKEALATLPGDFCAANALVPLDVLGEGLMLAVAEMPSLALLAEIRERSGLKPFLYVAVRRAILEALAQADPKNVRKPVDWKKEAEKEAARAAAKAAIPVLNASTVAAVPGPAAAKPVLAARTPPVLPERKKEQAPKTWEVMFDEIDTKLRSEPGDG